jgi:hypothetical protein
MWWKTSRGTCGMSWRRGEGIIQWIKEKKYATRDWVQLADEGVQWWALMNMVTNSRAPTVKAKLFLCVP